MSYARNIDKKSQKDNSFISLLMTSAAFGSFAPNATAQNEDYYYNPEFIGLDGQDFINFGTQEQAEALTDLQTALEDNSRFRSAWTNTTPLTTSIPLTLEGNFNSFLNHLANREGIRNDVYHDSLGKLTVGVGHLVLDSDNLKFGDVISDEQVRSFLEKDASKAWNAALSQAEELGVSDPRMVEALASVNYQLGTEWNHEFKNTWAAMKAGDYEKAAHNVQQSLWAQQTPVRVADLQHAMLNYTG